MGLSVPGENDNGRRMIDLFSEIGLCVGNTYFEHKSWLKYSTPE